MPRLKQDALRLLDDLKKVKHKLLSELSKVIVGQADILNLLFSSLLSSGHSLLIGVPGLAKTLMISSLAQVLDLSFNRIQFTPDLMPSDITGSDIIEESGKQKKFRFIPGPVFSNIVLADEINRTPPKTQAALLQSMQEKQVTVSGKTYNLSPPFLVLATQNPIEQEGTYPLPEAQLDRFMYSITIPYPTHEDETRIIASSINAYDDLKLKKVMTKNSILKYQQLIKDFPIADSIIEASVRLIRETRPETSSKKLVKDYIAWGAGPRAGSYLILAAKSYAALKGKKAVDLEDIRDIALPVLQHRLLTNYEAEADGVTPIMVINDLLDSLKI